MSDNRMSKIDNYLLVAKTIALRSPCARRKYGAILVKDDTIIETGYCGSCRGSINCGINYPCIKDLYEEEHNKSYDHCPSVHAEMNVLLNAARNGHSVIGATLFLSEVDGKGDRPCFLCRRFMIQAGIKECYYIKDGHMYHETIEDWVEGENQWMRDQLHGREKIREP